MVKRFFIVFGITLFTLAAKGQELPADSSSVDDFEIMTKVIRDGDTLLHSNIREVSVYPLPEFNSRREFRRYQRLVYNLKIVYPYASLAAEMLNDMNHVFLTLNTEKERDDYVKKVEKELMNEFEDDLKSLTLTQGRLLIKLIDRETGSTSYDLVKELRGSFSAFFWQAVARLFGSNLKTQFDAEGEDKLIDQIIYLIEHGQI
jgi:hypothetical protein